MPSPRKVLYVIPGGALGGAERATLAMAKGHDPRRYAAKALFFADGPLIAELAAAGIEHAILPAPWRLRSPRSVAAAIGSCAELIAREGHALVHSCMAHTHLVAGLAARRAGCPAVLYQHGPVGGWIDSLASLVPAARVLVNSRYTATCQRRSQLRRAPLELATLAVDAAFFADYDASAARAAFARRYPEIGAETFVFGAVARLAPGKGLAFAVEALAPILQQGIAKLVVVGGAHGDRHLSFAAELRALAAAAGVSRSVLLAGPQSDVAPFMRRFDALVHMPERPEGFGLVIAEAMATGKPVIASNAWGPQEIVLDGRTGYLVAPGDMIRFRARALELARTPPLCRQLGAAGRARALALYHPQVMMAQLEGIYDSLFMNHQETPYGRPLPA